MKIEEQAREEFHKMVMPIDGLEVGPFTYFLAGFKAAIKLFKLVKS